MIGKNRQMAPCKARLLSDLARINLYTAKPNTVKHLIDAAFYVSNIRAFVLDGLFEYR
jgi:hypothetical protein